MLFVWYDINAIQYPCAEGKESDTEGCETGGKFGATVVEKDR